MTPEEARHVTFSFGRVFPYRAKLTSLFYDILFEIAPESRPLFPDDMTGQKEKLANTIHMVVTNLNKLDMILEAVTALGARHAGYGAEPGHYEVVGVSLITALKRATPGGLTEAEESAWLAAYGVISKAMIEAGAAAAHAQEQATIARSA